MNASKTIPATFIFVVMAMLITEVAWGQGRVARVTKDIFLYSNWDAPHVTLDTCLDMTITEAHIPDQIEHNGRTYPVIEIGPGAFQGCHNLTAVFLPKQIGGILRDAFYDCPNLQVIVCPSEVPFSLENNHPFYSGSFNNIFEAYHAQQVVVVVPPGSEEAYRNTPGWCYFSNIQSTMTTEAQLQSNVSEGRIMQLRAQLERAKAEVRRIEKELSKLLDTANATAH